MDEMGKGLKYPGDRNTDLQQELSERLSHSYRMMQYIIEHDHNAIAVLNRDLKYIFISKRWLKDYNITEKDILGKNHYEVFPGLPDSWKEIHKRGLAGEVLSSDDDSFINWNGELTWVRWECRPWYELDGSIGGIILYTEVVNDQKKTELALINAKEKAEEGEKSMADILNKLNEAQHIAKIGSWDWNIKTGKVWWSEELYTIFEVSPEEYVPTFELNTSFIHPEDREGYHSAALNSLKTGEMLDYQLRIMAQGKIKHCKSMAKVHLDNEGMADRMTGTILDITEQVETMNELHAAKERAEESDRLKMAFLQNISHEVRTPLNSIVGFSELISEPGQSLQKMNSFSKIISANSQKLIRIISDVIELSQIQSNQIRLVLSNFDVVSLAYKVANTFMEITQLKDVDLIINQEIVEENSMIVSDKGKLEKIFFHLIDNAVKFTQTGSVLTSLNIKDELLHFTISDTGIGIPEEKQKVIFDPFRQLETGMNRSFGGTGLGLSIVKAYVDTLKGEISLHSEINKGTNIYISIPITKGIRKHTEQNNLHNHDDVDTILIAEDEYSNFKYLYEVLHSDNIEILHANNGREAVDICRKSKEIKMILMDLKMPVLDGTSAAKQIREFRPQLPIVAQSVYVHDAEKVNPVFNDHISKPINRHDLMQIMSRYVHVPV